MDYTELIAALHTLAADQSTPSFDARILRQAADAIEAMSRPGWISVEERLPECGMWVLTCRDNAETIWPAYINGEGEWMDEQCAAYCVTHWMPLPEPPEAE